MIERPCWHIFIAGRNRDKNENCQKELASSDRWEFVGEIWSKLESRYTSGCTPIGVYANGVTFGTDSPIHRDNDQSNSGLTALIFTNEYWPASWGGETVFYDASRTEIVESLLPKPGRLVIFDGRMPHNVRSPSSNCNMLRTSVVFKTMKEP